MLIQTCLKPEQKVKLLQQNRVKIHGNVIFNMPKEQERLNKPKLCVHFKGMQLK